MARRPLTREEYDFIEGLKARKIFDEVAGHRLDLSQGAMCVMCSDGDRSWDAFAYQGQVVREQCADPRIHLFADNGGPLLLAPNSPIVSPRSTRTGDLMRSIEGGSKMKGIKTLQLLGHTQCGMADASGIVLQRYLNLVLCGKTHIKSCLKALELKVACFIQVDYVEHHPENRLRTYFFNKTLWHQYFSPQVCN